MKNIAEAEFENCTFTNCSLYNSDISGSVFIDCKFKNCDLSLVNATGTTLNNVEFIDCKLMGTRFENCNDFGLSLGFVNCLLKHSSFYGKKIKETNFTKCELEETDFTLCDLTGSIFDDCNLTRAVFNSTILENADLSTAYNFIIDPEINRIKKAKFSLMGLPGLLDNHDIVIEQ